MPYIINPIKTVGNAINVFRKITKIFLPINLFKAIIIPKGTAIKELIKTAENETFNEVITILKSEASKLKIKLKDKIKASKKKSLSLDSEAAAIGKIISFSALALNDKNKKTTIFNILLILILFIFLNYLKYSLKFNRLYPLI